MHYYGACLLISLISCGHFASFTSILEPLKFYTLNAIYELHKPHYDPIDASKGKTADDIMARNNATFSLLLPGDVLNLTTLSHLRKFRDRGNKPGAVQAWRLLEEGGLRTVIEFKARRGTDLVSYERTCVYLMVPYDLWSLRTPLATDIS